MRLIVAALAALIFLAALPALAQAPPVAIFSGKVKPLGYCQITNLVASTQLSACTGGIPTGATTADIIVEAQAIRYRTDGGTPTAAIGQPLAIGTEKIFVLTDLTALRIIAQTVGAIVNVEFF